MSARFTVMLLTLIFILACRQEKDETATLINYTLEQIESPSQKNSSLARLFSNENQLWMSWVEQNDSTASLFHAYWQSGRWTAPELVAQGSDWFNNWLAQAVEGLTPLANEVFDDGAYSLLHI